MLPASLRTDSTEFCCLAASRLLGRTDEVGNQVFSLLLLLESSEDHLGARDVLLRVGEIHVESVRGPRDALRLVGVRVHIAGCLTRLAPNKTVEVGTGLVLAARLHRVALCTPLHEQLLALLNVAHCQQKDRLYSKYITLTAVSTTYGIYLT
ncbi:hypothetical protein E2C01_005592 [Portunus trituberculatus]|uniref:Uncharacterized protein n=1 Tax=Portunus trituberculatus TaxID=210409 RepID=A0A5B7CST8_PORTR|nr:hypothetical protein [Portunus trituberculatus]